MSDNYSNDYNMQLLASGHWVTASDYVSVITAYAVLVVAVGVSISIVLWTIGANFYGAKS